MKPIYVDYVPRWVPVVAGLLITAGAWFGGNIAHLDIRTNIGFVIGLFGALIVAIFFQGRYYWRGQVKTLSSDGMRYEAVTSVWIGPGRHVAFTPTEAKDWGVKAGAPAPDGRTPLPSAIRFAVRSEKLVLSLINPERLDLDALSSLNPSWFKALRRDHPGLKSITK